VKGLRMKHKPSREYCTMLTDLSVQVALVS